MANLFQGFNFTLKFFLNNPNLLLATFLNTLVFK